MLEALISLRRDPDTLEIGADEKAAKWVGDVLVVKVSPAIWGNEEKRLFLIALLDDSELEAGVVEVKAYPYAKTVQRPDENGVLQDVVTNRSRYRVDLNMFVGSPGLDQENITEEPCGPTIKTGEHAGYLEKADLIFDDADRI